MMSSNSVNIKALREIELIDNQGDNVLPRWNIIKINIERLNSYTIDVTGDCFDET